MPMLRATVWTMTQMSLLEPSRNSRNKTAVLKRLERGPATNIELNAICFRYGARIFELRKEGHDIAKTRTAPGLFVYTLRRTQ